jgi:DNA topoisomerase
MKIAESLYNRGYISYPRTETDEFPPLFDFQALIRQQCGNPTWGSFAEKLLDESSRSFSLPRKGKNNDQAHPPIHPTKPGLDLSGTDAKIYEFITRRFLACCATDAEGLKTDLTLILASERFFAHGTVVLNLNYMEVYIYDKWHSAPLPTFIEGEPVAISSLIMTSGRTSPGVLLSEADLISTMDKNGIGTDATIHDHIQTVINRGYVIRRINDRRFEPSPLGVALIKAFDAISLENVSVSLSKPALRKQLEEDLKAICEARKDASSVIQEHVRLYVFIYQILQQKKQFIEDSLLEAVNQTMIRPSSTPANPRESRGTSTRQSTGTRRPRDQDDEDDDEEGPYQPRQRISDLTNRAGTIMKTRQQKTSYSRDDQENSRSHLGPLSFERPIRCECNLEAKVAVAKSGENSGRDYATCIKTARRCKFWLWLDGEPSKKPQQTTSTKKQKNRRF